MDQKLIKREPLGKGFYVNVTPHHTFGTDAVVLRHFANPKLRDKLVDLGTGCGIIPLLMLRDNAVKSAVGVDISKEATDLAEMTVKELEIQNFKVVNCDLKELKGKVDFGCHTLVTCNPPYKAPNAGLKNPDKVESVARHEVACTLEDIIVVSAKLLQTSGRLCMCHRPERLAEILSKMSAYKLEPKRLRFVCQRFSLQPFLVLIEGQKCSKPSLKVLPTLSLTECEEEMFKIYGDYKDGYKLY